jgi:hypothetical protein
MSAEKTVNDKWSSTYTVAAPCGTFIGTVDVWCGPCLQSTTKKATPPTPYAARRNS